MDESDQREEELLEKPGSKTPAESPVRQQKADSAPTCESMKSSASMFHPMTFRIGDDSGSCASSCASSSSEPTTNSRAHCRKPHFLRRRSVQQHRPPSLDSIFTLLEENIVQFVKSELKKFKKVLGPERSKRWREEDDDEEEEVGGDDEQRSSSDALLKITLNFLRRIKEEQLADTLQSKTLAALCQRNLKSNLKKKFQHVFEGIPKAGTQRLLNEIYTELYVTQGDSTKVNEQHEIRQVEDAAHKPGSPEKTIRCEDVFKPSPGRDDPVRTVLTKGVAGVGKTVLTQKFILNWAEDKDDRGIQFIFPITFREISLLKEKKYSLVELLHHIFTETKEAGICRFEEFQVLFIFDGLDECRLRLDFGTSEILTDVNEPASVPVLLTNLIRGKLLPAARLWITSRPAAANQIPSECVDMVTEVRGFSDPQKAEYFRKRFKDQEVASRIVSHIESSRSLHIMCHIPVFCWISAAVLEHVLKTRQINALPRTLTEMYIHFLVVQTKQWNVKYHRSAVTDPVWNAETKNTILTLGKLAFEQLDKGNLIFYEADLKECGVDIKAGSVHSGLLTEILKDTHGLNQERVFCFVHLSIQEFLAALYVFLIFINTGENLLKRGRFSSVHLKFYQRAVDMALQSPNGHLDLFVRFLLGLSLESNQTLLRGLLMKTGSTPQTRQTLVQYIKGKISENPFPERSINLLHCLNELNDNSLVEEIQEYLRSGSSSQNKLSSSQWSALVFILLSSQKGLDVFDLKKFSASGEGLLWLLQPVIKASKTSLLSGCELSQISCQPLVPVLTSKNSSLRVLDLSDNDLLDTGAMLLSAGLKSPDCRLEVLRLSGCQITEDGCTFLLSALNANPSHLRELDLSFNHPGDAALKMLSAGEQTKVWKLESLKIDHCGACRLKPSPMKFSRQLTLDLNTAHRHLSLFDHSRRVSLSNQEQPYADHPLRFDGWKQLLCGEGLTGRCYWEVAWRGRVSIGVAYDALERRGAGDQCCLGWNQQSWSLFCSDQGYVAWHDNTPADLTAPPASDCNTLAVYLDWSAGTVSFYCLAPPSQPIHLHTFRSTFTEPLYPAFGFRGGQTAEDDSRWFIYLTKVEG